MRNAARSLTSNGIPNCSFNCKLSSASNLQPQPYSFHLRFLQCCNGNVSKCFGCSSSLHGGLSPAQAPGDLIVMSRMPRPYVDKTTGEQKEGEITNVYFHMRLSCIRRKMSDFGYAELILPEETRNLLQLVHKRHLTAVTGIEFQNFQAAS